MKSFSLKIGISLLALYLTGWLWLPQKAVVALYTFDAAMISRTWESIDAAEYASRTCVNDDRVAPGAAFDRCWDNAKSEYLARRK